MFCCGQAQAAPAPAWPHKDYPLSINIIHQQLMDNNNDKYLLFLGSIIIFLVFSEIIFLAQGSCFLTPGNHSNDSGVISKLNDWGVALGGDAVIGEDSTAVNWAQSLVEVPKHILYAWCPGTNSDCLRSICKDVQDPAVEGRC